MLPHSTASPNASSSDAADRRAFLRRAGLAGLVLSVPGALSACADAVTPAPTDVSRSDERETSDATVTLDFSKEIDVLNYAYALEQLEAAFYVKAIASPYNGMSASESRLLTDVRDHEIAHRDFFAAALGSARIPNLTPNFSSIDFTSRRSVLWTARTFEDLGVGAYNGAARYLRTEAYVLTAGKIVSVEARHASAIRGVLEPLSGYFAPNAFDQPISPPTVLSNADPFIVDRIVAINT